MIYKDSTPKLNVGWSAFEDWFQQQPFATQAGIKQLCRDSYAAGMGDPLVTYAQPAPKQEFIQPGYQLVPVEPTDKMVQASLHLDLSYMPLQEGYDRAAVYKAMLAAAPVQAQPAPKQEPSYRSVPHGHCTHPKCKELFQEYLVLSEKIAKYEPEGKSPMILNAVPKQEPVAYLVYAKGSHKYMTLTFDTDKVPEIYKGGDVVALCAAGAQAKQVLENLDELSVGDSLFESWFSEYRPAHKGTKQQMRDAYAAGMGDPLVAPPQAQSDHIADAGKMVQPLTFDQIEDIWTKHGLNECDCHGFARAIEQAHGIKVQP